MTLKCYKFEFSQNFARFCILRGNKGKTNEDRPVLSAMRILRWHIAGRSSARGLQLQYSEQKWWFPGFMGLYRALMLFVQTLALYQSFTYLLTYLSRKRYEIRPMLLLMTNRKLHIRFRLAARSMTWEDPEHLYVWILSEFRVISQIWEATTAKRMTIDLYCQRCIYYVDILLGVPPVPV